MKTLAERVRWAREVAAVSARELADLSGCTAGHISMIETGRRDNLTSEAATGIARAFGVSLDWLINGDGKDPSERAIRAAVEVKRAS